MAQIFQPELTDSFEIKVLGGDNIFKTVQEILDYGTSSNIGNCFILFDNCSDGYPALKNKGGYMIKFFYLQSLLTPTKVYLATDTYLKTGYGDSGTTIPDHMIGYAMYLINTEEPWNTITVSNTTAPIYPIYHINTNGDFTNSTAWEGSWRRAFLNENEYYNTDTYIGYFGSGLHSGYDEVIYIDPSIYEELYIDGQYVPPGPTGATVKVNYYIPEGAYQYCKLTYKKDKEPESVNDGTIINIDPTETDCLVEGLEEEQTYYFTIYTDKSESNPFPFVVGEVPGPTPPEPSVERKDLIYCNWGSGNVTFRATIGQQYSFKYNNIDYDDCYYPFAFWTTPEGGQMYVVGGDLDNYGTSYIYYNCALYSGSKSSVQQLDNACPIFDSFNADCLTWARRGYL